MNAARLFASGGLARAARLLTASAAISALAACVTQPIAPATQIVLLPQADGTPSAVVVTTAGGSSTLSQPFQRATLRDGDKTAPAVDRTTADEARATYGAILSATPPAPARFTVFFQTGGTQLTAESQAVMATVLREALARSGAELVITGHTDTVGAGPANDALSLRRAEDVRALFIGRGFAPTRIEAAGRGERELAVPTADNVAEPRNRRVDILVR